MDSVDFMLQFDDGSYDESRRYVGPFWVGDSLLVVLSQDYSVNYLAFLHDKAYEKPLGYGVKEIDFHFIGGIIEETGNLDLANVYGKWIGRLNFISWYQSRIIERWNKWLRR